MRIVSGKHRGRTIIAPKGHNTRPTSDQTRESVFNIIKHADWAIPIEEAIIADIFAGSGAFGLEALSRGADFCLFVETEPKARAAIRENVEHHKAKDTSRLHRYDATKLKIAPGNLRGKFTHIFMDPPYHKGMGLPVLSRLNKAELIADNALIMYEMHVDEDYEFPGFEVMQTRTWGIAKVVFMRSIGANETSKSA